MNMPILGQAIWGHIWKRGDKSNKCNQCADPSSWSQHLKMHLGKSQTNAIDVTMHPLSRRFEETFENTEWRKTKQMQPVWLCLFSGRQIEETFENARRRKVTQMQSVWWCILSGRRLEETFENAEWRKVKQHAIIRSCMYKNYLLSEFNF